jgi:hypothetical protein
MAGESADHSEKDDDREQPSHCDDEGCFRHGSPLFRWAIYALHLRCHSASIPGSGLASGATIQGHIDGMNEAEGRRAACPSNSP